MSIPSSLRERLGLQAQIQDESLNRSGTPVVLDLRTNNALARPVALARTLQQYGVDLKTAHLVLNDLKAGNRAKVQIYVADLTEAITRLETFGVRSRVRPSDAEL